MTNRQDQIVFCRQRDQLIALGDAECHWFFDEQVPLGGQNGAANFVVPAIRDGDVDRVDVIAGQQLAVIGMDRCARMGLPRGRLRYLRRHGDGPQLRPRRGGDCARVMRAEEAVADEAEAETHPFSAPATRPRTTYFCSSRTNRSVGSRPSRQTAIMSVKNTK